MEETLTIKEVATRLKMSYDTVYAHRFHWGFFRMAGSRVSIIARRREEQLSPYVFHRGKGKRIIEVDRDDFNRAAKRCNINDFRFHDLRHTWASWHVQNGTPLMVLKELGGWETLEMVKRYAHLNADHLLSYANHVKLTSKCLLDTTKFDAKNDILDSSPEKKKAVSY